MSVLISAGSSILFLFFILFLLNMQKKRVDKDFDNN